MDARNTPQQMVFAAALRFTMGAGVLFVALLPVLAR